MAKGFHAGVDNWVKSVKGAQINIFKASVQKTIEVMQTTDDRGGNLPFDLGFLRSSLRVSLNAPHSGLISREREESAYRWTEETTYQLTINGAGLEDSIYAVYLADYAQHQEYGTKYMSGKHFRDLAAQQWQQIVADQVAIAKRMIST